MFKFLKDKIKGAVESFSKKAPEEAQEVEKTVEEKPPEEPVETQEITKGPETDETDTGLDEEPAQKPATPQETEKVAETTEEPVEPESPTESQLEPPEQAPAPQDSAHKKPQEEATESKPEPREAAAQPEEKTEAEQKKGFFTRLSEKITTIQLTEEQFDDLFWDLELGLLENNVAVEVIERIKQDLREELTTGRTARGNLEERILRRLEETLRDVLEQEGSLE